MNEQDENDTSVSMMCQEEQQQKSSQSTTASTIATIRGVPVGELLCPVCYNFLDVTAQLPCAHVLCFHCGMELIVRALRPFNQSPLLNTMPAITCPMCRQEHVTNRIPFPRNAIIESVSRATTRRVPCGLEMTLLEWENSHSNDCLECLALTCNENRAAFRQCLEVLQNVSHAFIPTTTGAFGALSATATPREAAATTGPSFRFGSSIPNNFHFALQPLSAQATTTTTPQARDFDIWQSGPSFTNDVITSAFRAASAHH